MHHLYAQLLGNKIYQYPEATQNRRQPCSAHQVSHSVVQSIHIIDQQKVDVSGKIIQTYFTSRYGKYLSSIKNHFYKIFLQINVFIEKRSRIPSVLFLYHFAWLPKKPITAGQIRTKMHLNARMMSNIILITSIVVMATVEAGGEF